MKIIAKIQVLILSVGLVLQTLTGFTLYQAKEVKVGVSDVPYVSEIDENGNRTGIIIDYMSEIAKYAGWRIEYVDVSMMDSITLLQNHEIDLIGNLRKNEATEEIFDFPEVDSGKLYITIITKKDRVEFIPNDYDTFDNSTIALYSNATTTNEALISFCKKNNLMFKYIFFDSTEECRQAVERGEADGYVNTNVYINDGEKILARFNPTPNYFATWKGNDELLRELNMALEKLNSFEPDFSEKIYSKYFKANENFSDFNLVEKDYIASEPLIKVVMVDDYRPYVFSSTDGAEKKGVFIDYLEEISRASGLKFAPVFAESFDSAKKMLSNGEADMFCGVFDAHEIQDEMGYSASLPYMRLQAVLISNGNSISTKREAFAGKKIALVDGRQDSMRGFEGSVIVRYEKAEDCIDAVKSKQADLALVGYISWENYVRRNGSSFMSATAISGEDFEFSFVYGNTASPNLISIVDKMIFQTSQTAVDSIVFNNTVGTGEITFAQYLYANPQQTIMFVVLFFIILIVVVLIVMGIRLKFSKELGKIAKAYQTIGMSSNEFLFEYDYASREMTIPEQFGEITGIPTKLNASNALSEMLPILDFFDNPNEKIFNTIEFETELIGGNKEWFKAEAAIIFDKEKPVKGFSKVTSTQVEHEEKLALEKKANTDELTGLFNKKYCETLVDDYLSAIKPYERTALVMIDVDDFKQVNDSIGHLGGDKVLVTLAKKMKDAPLQNVCGRFGGDEFFMFIRDVKSQKELMIKLENLLKATNIEYEFEGYKKTASISMGVAITTGGDNSFQALLSIADKALYKAKAEGKNRIVFIS